MTYLDAAYQVLSQANQPLHAKEISRRALELKLIKTTGLTPDMTMGSQLYMDTLEEGSRFVRAGKGLFDLARHKTGTIEAQVDQINRRTRDQLHELLLKIPSKRFEMLIVALLLKIGFDESTVKVTPFSGDGGIDITGVYRASGLTEVEAAVQALRWREPVSSAMIIQLRGSLQLHQQGIFITTGGFSPAARAEAIAAGKTRIALIDGEHLVEMLIKNRVGAVEKRLTVNALDEEWWGEFLGMATRNTDTNLSPASTTSVSPESNATASSADTKVKIAGNLDDKESNDTLTGRKPVEVRLLNKTEQVRSWRDVLLVVCDRLYEQHEEEFIEVALSLHGRTRQYFSDTPYGMYMPIQHYSSQLYVEMNMNAVSIMRLCHLLLQDLGYSPDELAVELVS